MSDDKTELRDAIQTAADALAQALELLPAPPQRPAGRAGKAMVAGWYDKAAVKQLRMIEVNHETTIQQQLGRAINLLLREEGLPALAQIERADDSA